MHGEGRKKEKKKSVLTVASYSCERHHRWRTQIALAKMTNLLALKYRQLTIQNQLHHAIQSLLNDKFLVYRTKIL